LSTDSTPDESMLEVPDTTGTATMPEDDSADLIDELLGPISPTPAAAPVVTTEPAISEPAITEPAMTEPAMTEPAMTGARIEAIAPVETPVESSATMAKTAPATTEHATALPTGTRTQARPVLVGIGAGILALLGVAAVIGLAMWGRNSASTATTEPGATGKLGQSLADGTVTFTVTKVTCGLREMSSTQATRTAAGQFCAVAVSVANRGDQKATLSGSLLTAYDRTGANYRLDEPATAYANAGRHGPLGDLPPGATVTGILVYDVPLDSRLVRLELHGAARSKGVIVNV